MALLPMMDNHIITQKGLSKQSFFGGRDGTRSINSIGLRAHSLHGTELNQSLVQSRLACCGCIITQINKNRSKAVLIHQNQ